MGKIITIVVVAVLAIGTSVAAQNALPGEALYGVKTGINEKVQLALTFGPEAKAKAEANIADVRLREAEEVAINTKLNATLVAKVEANFKAFSDRVLSRTLALADIDAKAAADIAGNFETSLNAHTQVLADLKTRVTEDDEKVSLTTLKDSVDVEVKKAKEIKERIEAKVEASASVEASANGKITAAGNKIAEVRKFIDLKKAQISAQAVASAEVKLTQAATLLAAAKIQVNQKSFAAAFSLASNAHQTAQQAKLLVELHEDIDEMIKVRADETIRSEGDLEVKENIDINENENVDEDKNENVNTNINDNINRIINGNTNDRIDENVNANLVQ